MTEQPDQTGQPESAASADTAAAGTPQQRRVVVMTEDGMGVATSGGSDGASGSGSSGRSDGSGKDSGQGEQERRSPAELVEEPAKVMRIGSMIKQLLEEVRSAPLDDAGRARLAEIFDRSIAELKDGLAPELVSELDRIALPFSDEATPSDAELRIAHAQLVGWLEGLFHGIQAALFAQQMISQTQLEQLRALPPGLGDAARAAGQGGSGGPGSKATGMRLPGPGDDTHPTGQSL